MAAIQPGFEGAPAGSVPRGKDDAGVNGAVGLRVWPGLLVLAALLAACLPLRWEAAAQAPPPASQLVTADPMPNARLFAAPERIVLTAAVPIAPDSARIRLLGAGGVEIPLEPAAVDPRRRLGWRLPRPSHSAAATTR